MTRAFGLGRACHKGAELLGQIVDNPTAAAALAIDEIPTLPALRAAAFSAHPEIGFLGSALANLAAAVGAAGPEVAVPPAAIRRKHRYAILFAQPAAALFERPAVVLADQQAAARAIECHAARDPAIA